MSNPWDLPPYPLYGDQDQAVLYEWLGRTLESWERVEFELACTYSLCVGDPEWTKVQEYGAGKIFRERIAALEEVARAFFVRRPNQQHEGQLRQLILACRGFADRRNEIAHSMIMDVSGFLFWQDKLLLVAPYGPQFLLVPPYYLLRKHNASGLPAFGYSSWELRILQKRLVDLLIQIGDFNDLVWPRELRGSDEGMRPIDT